MELFEEQQQGISPGRREAAAPLAERVRPGSLEEFVGQEGLLGNGAPLRTLIERDEVPSVIFWGPPGCGKTTLARIVAGHTRSEFHQISAVAAGVNDVRKIIERARAALRQSGRRTILFIDEIHRFNKAQQDALLHSVEGGVITLIGATTENPSFEVIPPLLSRCRVYVLEPLGREPLDRILDRALASDPVLSRFPVRVGRPEREALMLLSGGDARTMLNGLETAVHLTPPGTGGERVITSKSIAEAFQRRHIAYDDGGEEHYNIISAFIKSMRGSDPDAAIYWLARMLEGGEDPRFIARRMLILASEDVGNADPRALPLAAACFSAVEAVGMPEARIVLSQTAAYLASAPKSNASIAAIDAALDDVRKLPNEPVPLHLRNAPTKLMKELKYGDGYKVSHAYDGNFSEQQYLPDNRKDVIYYRPSLNGEESDIRNRLNTLWKEKQR